MIKIGDLIADERTITVEYQGETAKVIYRPSAYTPIVEERAQDEIDNNRPGSGLANLLEGMLIRWEVVGEDGEELPPTVEVMREMPVSFLTAMVNAVVEDMNVSREEIKNSGGGSLAGASKGKSRRGTR